MSKLVKRGQFVDFLKIYLQIINYRIFATLPSWRFFPKNIENFLSVCNVAHHFTKRLPHS